MYHIRWKHKNESVAANYTEILWGFVVVCRNLLIRDFILTALLLQCLILKKKRKILWHYQLSSVNEGMTSHHPQRWLSFGCKGFLDIKEKAISYKQRSGSMVRGHQTKTPSRYFFFLIYLYCYICWVFNFNNFKFRWILKIQHILKHSNIFTKWSSHPWLKILTGSRLAIL